ncbi:NAD(P)H-dependent oxidoreductase [Pandoraea oxalativorans]|uniref:NAD(P)H dehydrogenase n=1 Tax=Pandoraea oxalativorans TaxID=573737 RepID=A0A0E3U532_9BURK|nr:NAD(P)H-dependent oxidoreductase [Pandoraea oxalativorans]AKC68278.1 NAD(P)H dehydrogenase [Pandoraea oxalativorans]
MNVLIVYAHPQPRSLNGALRDFAVQHLEAAGHHVQVSDLYAMQWKTTIDVHDAPQRNPAEPFHASLDSKQAFLDGTQRADIAHEQEKLRWADTVIFQFPLWWFSMPAIMKGWFDRVYAYGFAYGVGEHSSAHWGDRYGEGSLSGKRAMLVVTTGGWDSHYSARGINGPIDDILFPIQHGVLFYPGFDVLPPFVTFRSSRVDAEAFATITRDFGKRLDTLATIAPIPYRRQNFGDYEIPALTLKDEIATGVTGYAAHVA